MHVMKGRSCSLFYILRIFWRDWKFRIGNFGQRFEYDAGGLTATQRCSTVVVVVVQTTVPRHFILCNECGKILKCQASGPLTIMEQ